MTSTWESDWQLAARERDDLVAERDALRTQNTALIKQMGVSVENERQWGEGVAKLEAAMRQFGEHAKWLAGFVNNEVESLTPESRSSPTSPSADHPDSSLCGESSAGTGGRSSLEPPPLLERTLQAGYDIQTRQRDEIRELRKALSVARSYVDANGGGWCMGERGAVKDTEVLRMIDMLPTESPPRRDQICSNEYSELGAVAQQTCEHGANYGGRGCAICHPAAETAWICTKCSASNSDDASTCAKCDWDRPSSKETPPKYGTCPVCGGMGGAHFTHCKHSPAFARETACECMPLDVRGTPGDLEIFFPKCSKVFRSAQHAADCHLKAGGPACTCSTSKIKGEQT